jgi:hypothetical protein
MSSSSVGLPLFGRAWQLTIKNSDGTTVQFGTTPSPGNPFVPEPLQITFDIKMAIQGWWTAEIVIYNLNGPTEQEVLVQGNTITLDAGYQNKQYGTIFQGTIYQPLWERENGTDYKVTLLCVCGLIEDGKNFVNQTIASGYTQRQLVAQMAAACRFPLDASNVDPLSSMKQTRASTYFGQPGDHFQDIADFNNANMWFSNLAINIGTLAQQNTLPTISYGPGTGLLGTPQQTQEGVEMIVNLDPRPVLRSQVQLNENVVIAQLARSFPSYPTILDKNGLYIVGRINHVGDSRGNTWDTRITGFVNAASILSLQAGI